MGRVRTGWRDRWMHRMAVGRRRADGAALAAVSTLDGARAAASRDATMTMGGVTSRVTRPTLIDITFEIAAVARGAPPRARLRRATAGQGTVEFLLLLPLLLLFFAGIWDGGSMLIAQGRLEGVATSAAVAAARTCAVYPTVADSAAEAANAGRPRLDPADITLQVYTNDLASAGAASPLTAAPAATPEPPRDGTALDVVVRMPYTFPFAIGGWRVVLTAEGHRTALCYRGSGPAS